MCVFVKYIYFITCAVADPEGGFRGCAPPLFLPINAFVSGHMFCTPPLPWVSTPLSKIPASAPVEVHYQIYFLRARKDMYMCIKLVRRSIYSFAPKERVGAIVTLALIINLFIQRL